MNLSMINLLRVVILFVIFISEINKVFSQETIEKDFNLNVEICKSYDSNSDLLLKPIKLIIDRIDTIELENKNSGYFEISLKRNFNFHRPKYARLSISKDNPESSLNRQIQSPYFLIDTAKLRISWDLNSNNLLINGGKENEVFQLFNFADIELFEDLKNNLNSIDSLKINKIRNDLKLVQKYNKEYTSYVKLLTLFRPSFFNLRADIEETILSLDKKSFSSNEIEMLRNKFDAYIQQMELKLDKSNFPEFLSISYNDKEPFNAIKAQYKYVLLDIWATWCGPCLQQHPTINSLSLKYKDSETFTIVGIAISSPKDQWIDYLMKGVINYPNYFLNEETSDSLISSIGIIEIPRYALLRTEDSKLIESNIDFKNIEDILKKYKLIN